MSRLIRRLIKYGPIIYPIIKKLMNKRKQKRNIPADYNKSRY